MKNLLLHTVLLGGLLASCGGEDGDNESGEGHHRHRKCHTVTSGEAWRDFVANVKDLSFPEFSSSPFGACMEYTYSNKGPNCDRKGIFHICDGTTYYNKAEGSTQCSSGPLHEEFLFKLVTPRPVNFEAEICGGQMVRAQIAVNGKGIQPDLYQFDFERPIQFNPVWKQVWKDSDRRYKTIYRQ